MRRTSPKPWQVTDAPAGYIDNLLKAIVGVELRIASLDGKWKASQNRNEADRDGVTAGLEDMARIVRGRER